MRDLKVVSSLKFSDKKVMTVRLMYLIFPRLSKIKRPAGDTDSYLKNLFTRLLYNTVWTIPRKQDYGISLRSQIGISLFVRKQPKGGPTQHIHISIHRVNHNQFYRRCLYTTLACACS